MGSIVKRHREFAYGVATGAAVFAVATTLDAANAFTLAANAFFLAYSGLIVARIPRMKPAYLEEHARNADLPVLLIFGVTLLIVGAAVSALFELINEEGRPHGLQLALALSSLPLGWFTIQAMAAMHYAHLFWVGHRAEGAHGGGLEFSGDDKPGGTDFLYFAATIGMTAQTADTSITTTSMRRAVLVHAIVSFFFNTVLVAAAVNLAVSLGN